MLFFSILASCYRELRIVDTVQFGSTVLLACWKDHSDVFDFLQRWRHNFYPRTVLMRKRWFTALHRYCDMPGWSDILVTGDTMELPDCNIESGTPELQ